MSYAMLFIITVFSLYSGVQALTCLTCKDCGEFISPDECEDQHLFCVSFVSHEKVYKRCGTKDECAFVRDRSPDHTKFTGNLSKFVDGTMDLDIVTKYSLMSFNVNESYCCNTDSCDAETMNVTEDPSIDSSNSLSVDESLETRLWTTRSNADGDFKERTVLNGYNTPKLRVTPSTNSVSSDRSSRMKSKKREAGQSTSTSATLGEDVTHSTAKADEEISKSKSLTQISQVGEKVKITTEKFHDYEDAHVNESHSRRPLVPEGAEDVAERRSDIQIYDDKDHTKAFSGTYKNISSATELVITTSTNSDEFTSAADLVSSGSKFSLLNEFFLAYVFLYILL